MTISNDLFRYLVSNRRDIEPKDPKNRLIFRQKTLFSQIIKSGPDFSCELNSIDTDKVSYDYFSVKYHS